MKRRKSIIITQSYRTCNGDLLDILKKKKCKGHVTKEKIPPPFTFKKEQTKKQKQKQNKTNPRVSISNVGDQLWLGLVLKLPLIFNNVLIFRADVLIFRCFFNTVHSWFLSNQKIKVSDFYSMHDFVYW